MSRTCTCQTSPVPSEELVKRIFREALQQETQAQKFTSPGLVQASPYYPFLSTVDRTGLPCKRVKEIVGDGTGLPRC